jgi:23S rRNA (guanosine2251-2'-O)-methyltransferase
MKDSEAYRAKKAQFDQLLTLYGRKPVLEAIADSALQPERLHLSKNNRSATILDEIQSWAEKRNVEIRIHDPASLARISKNAKQDQGVALDIRCPDHQRLEDFLASPPDKFRLIALDGITNPQNLGMIIRSVAASPCDGLLISKRDTPKLSPLVIKASAGTLFKAPLIRLEKLEESLKQLQNLGTEICVLDSNASTNFAALASADRVVYVLGNETEGVSREIKKMATQRVAIPMCRGVESLNVAVTAALVAFNGV